MNGGLHGIDSHLMVGVALATAGAMSGGIGDSMMRSGYLAQDTSTAPRKVAKFRLIFGFILGVCLNPMFTMLSFIFIPVSLASYFCALHIFTTLVISKVWLREGLRAAEFVACFIGLLSLVGVVYATGSTNEVIDIGYSIHLLKQTASLAFIIPTTCAVCLVSVLAFLNARSVLSLKMRKITVLATPFSSGLVGGLTNLFGKIAVTGFTSMFSYNLSTYQRIVLISVILSAGSYGAMQILGLTQSLKNFPAGIVSPIINSVLIVSASAASFVVLQEIPQNPTIFFVGATILISSLILLSYSALMVHFSPASDSHFQPEHLQSIDTHPQEPSNDSIKKADYSKLPNSHSDFTFHDEWSTTPR